MRSVLKFKSPRIRISDYVEASATDMLRAVREQGLEGMAGKKKDSVYEPGKRTGAWIKYRVNRGQELVIGGYIPGPHGFDSLIVGYYRGKDLVYVARVRNGFVPGSRRQVFEKISPLVSPTMPFCQSTGHPQVSLGRRTVCRENEGMRLASPGGRHPNRIPGVDRGRSAQAFEVCRAA